MLSSHKLQSMFNSLWKNVSQNVPLHDIREGRSERREKGWNRDYGSREEEGKGEGRESQGGHFVIKFCQHQFPPERITCRLRLRPPSFPPLLLRMTGRTMGMGTFECSAISEKKYLRSKIWLRAQIEIFNRPTIQQICGSQGECVGLKFCFIRFT